MRSSSVWSRVLPITVMLMVLSTISAGVLFGGGRSAPVTMQTVTVSPGDTLWELAARHGPADEDIRATVDVIFRANHLTSTRLAVGQRLLVPVPR